jgi:hypothetical protein
MWFNSRNHGRKAERSDSRVSQFIPQVEALEDRTLPSNFTAANVTDLIADIKAANAAGGSNTITLVAGTTFTLTAVDNTADGATGLPVIAASDNLTIVGNGDVIQRSTATGTPAFRLLDVASGGSLTLANLTLKGGLASGLAVSAEGGAILNQGGLTLNGVSVQHNIAQGIPSGYFISPPAAGGGIYSNGSLTLQSSTFQYNQALGSDGNAGTNGGDANGGGLYVAGGTASLTDTILSSNLAQGGKGGDGGLAKSEEHRGAGHSGGGNGGSGQGGGLYVASGTVSLHSSTVNQNTASGGHGGQAKAGSAKGSDGVGKGGGLYIDLAALVCLDAFTQSHVTSNTASTSDLNIAGPWQPC